MATHRKTFDARTFSMNAEHARNIHTALEQEILDYAMSREHPSEITEAQLNLVRQYQSASALTHDLLAQLSVHFGRTVTEG